MSVFDGASILGYLVMFGMIAAWYIPTRRAEKRRGK